jgi:hypothetical protein
MSDIVFMLVDTHLLLTSDEVTEHFGGATQRIFKSRTRGWGDVVVIEIEEH